MISNYKFAWINIDMCLPTFKILEDAISPLHTLSLFFQGVEEQTFANDVLINSANTEIVICGRIPGLLSFAHRYFKIISF